MLICQFENNYFGKSENSEAYSGPCQTMMELFAKIVNGF